MDIFWKYTIQEFICLTIIDNISGLLIGCDKKLQIMRNFQGSYYAIRKANYAINKVNCAIFF